MNEYPAALIIVPQTHFQDFGSQGSCVFFGITGCHCGKDKNAFSNRRNQDFVHGHRCREDPLLVFSDLIELRGLIDFITCSIANLECQTWYDAFKKDG